MAFLENHPNVISTTKIRTPGQKGTEIKLKLLIPEKEHVGEKSGEPGIRSDGFKSSNSAAFKLVCTVLSLTLKLPPHTHTL